MTRLVSYWPPPPDLTDIDVSEEDDAHWEESVNTGDEVSVRTRRQSNIEPGRPLTGWDIYTMKLQDILITNPWRIRGMWSRARQQSTNIILLIREDENWWPTWQSRGMLMMPSRLAQMTATISR